MTQFIDRRQNSKNKNALNRQRFLQRFKLQIKKAVSDAVAKRNIDDLERGEKITIPAKDIREPQFKYAKDGIWEMVNPGNKEFISGDRIKRNDSSTGQQGGDASNSGEDEDNFSFELTREEFINLFFEDLALPHLVKKQLSTISNYKYIHAGYVHDGMPSNISIIRSLKAAHSRRLASGAASYKKQIDADEEKLNQLIDDTNSDKNNNKDNAAATDLYEHIQFLKNKLKCMPFIDPVDMRYHNREQLPMPATQAVMFCVMDVSGSMDEKKKEIAKRFFILLYLFLTRTYEKIELIFIRHHTNAKEVDEKEFFYSRETGGTVVSSALELTREIIQKRYSPVDWNIYIAQASDGDNWSADSPYCQDLLTKQIMPWVQYYAYVEIMPNIHQSLWEAYTNVKAQHTNFAMQSIMEIKDIYPVLHELFKKEVL